jgi:cell division protein FtsN
MSEYHERGLSPYWAKVDLGDKGVWFRFFAGYFQTKEEAEKFIRDRSIQGASPAITRYANLIGIYSTDKEVDDNRRALMSADFYPYLIKATDGKSFLYSGAFDQKEYAEKERTILASKGIKSEIIER